MKKAKDLKYLDIISVKDVFFLKILSSYACFTAEKP